MDNKSNSKDFWKKHVRSLAFVLIFYLLSVTPSFAQSNECRIGDLPSISFRSKSADLIAKSHSALESVAGKLKENPFCTIVVTSYPSASKAGQALCNKRIETIKTYFVEKKGISSDRIEIDCEVGGGDPNTADIKAR